MPDEIYAATQNAKILSGENAVNIEQISTLPNGTRVVIKKRGCFGKKTIASV